MMSNEIGIRWQIMSPMSSHYQGSDPGRGKECRKASDFSPGMLITLVGRQSRNLS